MLSISFRHCGDLSSAPCNQPTGCVCVCVCTCTVCVHVLLFTYWWLQTAEGFQSQTLYLLCGCVWTCAAAYQKWHINVVHSEQLHKLPFVQVWNMGKLEKRCNCYCSAGILLFSLYDDIQKDIIHIHIHVHWLNWLTSMCCLCTTVWRVWAIRPLKPSVRER